MIHIIVRENPRQVELAKERMRMRALTKDAEKYR